MAGDTAATGGRAQCASAVKRRSRSASAAPSSSAERNSAKGTTQRVGLAVGLAGLALLVVAAVARPRRGYRAPWAPTIGGSVAPWLLIATGGLAALALGGWAALVVATQGMLNKAWPEVTV